MATEKNISNASRNPKIDPAVAAACKMEAAGENDAAYNRAVDVLIAAKAATLAGVLEQFKLYRGRVESVADGDQLSAAGEAKLFAFGAAIESALKRFATN
jgi:hypothetical protein